MAEAQASFQRERDRLSEELSHLQVQGGGDWYGQFMAVDALYKDRDGRVKILEAEIRRQAEAYGEECAMRKMLEQ